MGKFAVAIALISTASAAVTEGCASVVDLTAATQTDHCDCPALCKACVHATPGTAADAKVTAADTTCTSCKATTDTFTKNDADTMGKCTAAAGDAGKALEGKECDGDGEDKGCADGLQCVRPKKSNALLMPPTALPPQAQKSASKPKPAKSQSSAVPCNSEPHSLLPLPLPTSCEIPERK